MNLRIDKSVFKNIAKGNCTVKVKFKNGEAHCEVHNGTPITFYMYGITLTATEGMTWEDWLASWGTASGNNYVLHNTDHADQAVYFNWNNTTDPGFNIGVPGYNTNNYVYKHGTTEQQYFTTVITDGATYSRTNSGAAEPTDE